MTQSVSQVDIFRSYLGSLDIKVTGDEGVAWRNVRGALVLAAGADAEQTASMRRFCGIVRFAVLEELRRAVPDNI